MANTRLKALRDNMVKQGIDLYYFNTSDYHMCEYVAEYFKTIRYFSGFTGSLATLLVSRKDAYIFVDGRYHIQADNQCKGNGVKVVKLGTKNGIEPIDFIKKYFSDKVIGLDGKRTSISFGKHLAEAGIKVKSVDIYSDIIENRAKLSNSQIYALADKYTGKSRKDKLTDVKYCLQGKCHIVNNLESIAYILNLRGDDIKNTPVFMSYLIFLNNDVYFFVDIKRLSNKILDELYADGVIVKPYNEYYKFITTIKKQTILLDPNKVNYETFMKIYKKNDLYYMRSIIEDMKACKNKVESKNTRLAHIYDGVAMVRFLKWLKSQKLNKLTEYDVVEKLNSFRLDYKAFDLSFDSIVAYNANAALMHYSPTKDNSAKLSNSGILLIDSGGQYLQGTTDITRTISLGKVSNEVKKYFTIVLKSMFNLSETVFMKGLSGNQVDIMARQELWKQGIDYRCGTGHGVGHVLAVHEMPPNVRYMNTEAGGEKVPFKPGMVFSDEPGVYFEGKYGIRCENLLQCVPAFETEYGEFYKFDTITMCPFDLNLIDKKYLDQKTIDVLNKYHETVYKTLSKYLDKDEQAFLKQLTKKI